MRIIKIGRNQGNDIRINKDVVSSFHAEVMLQDNGAIVLKDISTNGTYVNGQLIPRGVGVPVRRGDRVLLAKEVELDWSRIPENDVLAGLGKVNQKEVPENKPAKWKYLTAAVLLFIVLIFSFSGIKSWLKPTDVFGEYNNSVVLVCHAYVYEVNLGKFGTTSFTIQDGKVIPYNPKENSPMAITGTGFFVSGDGKLITNRHVALPWEYDENIDKVKAVVDAIISSAVNKLQNAKEALHNYNRTEYDFPLTSQIREYDNLEYEVTGKTTFLGYGLNNSYIEDFSDFKRCIVYKESGKDDIDVAVLQTNERKTPDIVKNYVNLDEAVTDDKKLKPGLKLTMIGYPLGFVLGKTTEGLKANYQNGQVSRESDGIRIGINNPSWHGASGSPVFNEEGKLVGVLHAGREESQGFNFAILAKYAAEIAK